MYKPPSLPKRGGLCTLEFSPLDFLGVGWYNDRVQRMKLLQENKMKRKKVDAVDNTSPAQVFTAMTHNGRVYIYVTEQADGFEKLVKVMGESGSTLWQIRR